MRQGNNRGPDPWNAHSKAMVPICNSVFEEVDPTIHLGWMRSRLADGMPYWAEHTSVLGPDGSHEWVTFILPLIPELYDLQSESFEQGDDIDWEEESIETEWHSLLCEGMQVIGQVLDSRPLFRHVDYLEKQGALHFLDEERNGLLLRLHDLAGFPVTAVVVMISEGKKRLAHALGPWRPFEVARPRQAMDQVSLWLVHEMEKPSPSESSS